MGQWDYQERLYSKLKHSADRQAHISLYDQNKFDHQTCNEGLGAWLRHWSV